MQQPSYYCIRSNFTFIFDYYIYSSDIKINLNLKNWNNYMQSNYPLFIPEKQKNK